MNARLLCTIWILLLFPHFSWSQFDYHLDYTQDLSYRFEAIGSEEGLSHKSVNALFQDHLGFIWLGTPIGLVKYDGYTFQTYQYELPDSLLGKPQLANISISAITEDPAGDLWVGCIFERLEKPVLFRFDRKTEKLVPYLFEANKTLIKNDIQDIQINGGFVWFNTPFLFRMKWPDPELDGQLGNSLVYEQLGKDSLGLQYDRFSKIEEDRKGRIWLLTWMAVQEWVPEPDTFRYHELPVFPEGSEQRYDRINNFKEMEDGSFWVFPNAMDYLLRFNPETGARELFKYDQYLGERELVQTTSGQFWLGRRLGRGGISIFDPASDMLETIKLKVGGSLFFPVARVRSMLQDFSGNIWIGLENGPLLKYEPNRNQFHWLHFQADEENSLSHNWVTGIQQDRAGHYWISTFGGGLNRWNRQENSFQHFRAKVGDLNSPLSDYLIGLDITQDGKIWFGEGFSAGSLDPVTGEFNHYQESGVVWTAYQDAQNRLWLAKFGGGLRLYDPQADDFRVMAMPDPRDSTQVIHTPLSGIFQDSRGDLWLGSHWPEIGGCFRFDPETETFEPFINLPEAHSFCEDRRGYLWIGSVDGLYRFDPKTEVFKRYGESEGLPNNVVEAIQEDDTGRLWVATNNGLSCFDPETETFRSYFNSDGIPPGNFHQTSYKNEQGELFFAGTFGMLYFHPDSIQDNRILPKPAFTGIDLFGKPLQIDKNGRLKKHLSLTRQLHFSHWQNDLTIHYAGLHFKNPQKNKYKVWLENYDKDWRIMGTQNFANYTNLDPGNYIFHVKAANSDGIWNEEAISLNINILAPWYWNGWSKVIYLMLIAVIVFSIYHFQLNRRLALAEAGRLRELDEVKTKLYTNITHEFRTPLTVIQGTTEQIEAHETEKEIIQRNSRNLLELVNRMLSLSKLEAGKLDLKLIHGDILGFLRYVTESFHSLALNRKLNLNFYADMDSIEMDYDPEKILQILSNLISNALKFTPEYGKVTIIARKKRIGNDPVLQLRVRDTGIGIAPEQIPFIFDRFYQVNAEHNRPAEGTGIGLALTKELVALMDGAINVESVLGEGTTFTVKLPICRDAPQVETHFDLSVSAVAGNGYIAGQSATAVVESSVSSTNSSGYPLLLIVEDNQDVRQYLASCLQADYQLLFARNGREGTEQALEYIPDIIISDVMMPEVDGFELCRTLKQDERTSHIPIILLTAKADITSKLEGLEFGADAYLAKPFLRSELEVRLRKLIELRRKLQARYHQSDFKTEAATEKEDAFILKIRRLVLDHLDDNKFGVEELSRALHLHRSQLHRKLKALTGKSTTHLINRIRLQEGYRLLQEGKLNVSEVAYAVGFSGPTYFSQLFSKEYGRPPSKI